MLIIVEGPPGSGKTSLVNKLRTALVHQHGKESVTTLYGNEGTTAGTRNTKYLERYLPPLEEYVPNAGQHIICDEWHWSLPAIRNVFATEPIQPSNIRYVGLKLAQLGAVVVHLSPSTETLLQRLDRRNPYLYPHPRIRPNMGKIRASYTSIMHDSDVTVLPSTASLTTILDTARHLEDRAQEFNLWSHSMWPFYLGSVTPKGVLISVEPTQYETLYPRLNSGEHYLHRAIQELTPQQRDSFGMLNAAHVTSESFVTLMTTLKAPRLLALGREASLFLGEVAHTTLPHHRQCRRLYPQHSKEYGALIHTALSLPVGTDLTKWSPAC